MEVSLSPEMTRFIEEKVRSGAFTTSDEVVDEALRRFAELDRFRATNLEELRKMIAVGLDQLNRGEMVDGEQVFEELRRKYGERSGISA